MKKLIDVSEKTFYEFINKNAVVITQGRWFHSDNYLDKDGNVIAYKETSSWGADTIYQILAEENLESLNIITNIINTK